MRNIYIYILLLINTIKIHCQNEKIENEFTNNYFSFKKNSKIKTKYYDNPCYMNGYVNESSKMKGTGDYNKCFELLNKIVNKDNNELEIETNQNNKNKTVINYNN